MKILADFKRALISGDEWIVKVHYDDGTFKQRVQKVYKVHSNHVIFLRDSGIGTYLYFPKATDFKVNEKGEAEIYFREDKINRLPRRLALTYAKVEI